MDVPALKQLLQREFQGIREVGRQDDNFAGLNRSVPDQAGNFVGNAGQHFGIKTEIF